jgi:hypothetical protein
VEAEAVALLCCESLRLPGAEFCRGFTVKGANAIIARRCSKLSGHFEDF